MPAPFAAYVYIPNQSVFTAGRHGTVTSAGNPDAPKLSQQKMRDVQAGGIVILICLAGFAFLALTDRR
jgi:hypothetical protein